MLQAKPVGCPIPDAFIRPFVTRRRCGQRLLRDRCTANWNTAESTPTDAVLPTHFASLRLETSHGPR
jgi:hypothetical protein